MRVGFAALVFGGVLLFGGWGSGRREVGAVALDVTNLFTMSARGRYPRVFDINGNKRAIHSTNFHFGRKRNGSINFHLHMCNTDAREA